MPIVEIGESSSPPPPMNVNEETNKVYNYDMYDNDDLIWDPNTPTRPKWEANTIHAARELAVNPSDPKRTTSQFKSSLSVKDPLFTNKSYLMVESDPKKYEESS